MLSLKKINLIFFIIVQLFPSVYGKSLTLEDAILLSVRDNPNVQNIKLSALLQSYRVGIERWQFYPHYQFEARTSLNQSKDFDQRRLSRVTYDVHPSASWLSPIGTKTDLTYSNQDTRHFRPQLSLQIAQPLMRGFGKPIVEAALNDSIESEVTSRLNIENTIRTTITNVINSYVDILFAKKILEIDEDNLRRVKETVKQTQLFIKAGHKAGNELISVKASVATAQTQLENDRNNLQQAKYLLLQTIGLNPMTELSIAEINLDKLIKKFKHPTLERVKELALANNIQYKIDTMTLRGSLKRALLLAEDNTRWKLDFNLNLSTGNGSASNQDGGIKSLIRGSDQTTNAALTLQIPIDDRVAKQAVIAAKVAIQQAEINLRQAKREDEIKAINSWNSVNSAKRSLEYAEDAEKLQKKTYELNYKKYLHGLIDSLELQTAQMQLIQAQQTKLSSQINYLKALVNLDLLIGHTLKSWDIKIND